MSFYHTLKGGKTLLHDTMQQAIEYAKKNNCQAYHWGRLIYGQLSLGLDAGSKCIVIDRYMFTEEEIEERFKCPRI
jgi:hypothetical protein